MQLSGSSHFEGRQTIEEFIRDSVALKASKRRYSKNLGTGKLVVFNHLFVRLTA